MQQALHPQSRTPSSPEFDSHSISNKLSNGSKGSQPPQSTPSVCASSKLDEICQYEKENNTTETTAKPNPNFIRVDKATMAAKTAHTLHLTRL